MLYLAAFAAEMGDFEFSAQRQPDGTYNWTKKLLNTAGAIPEQIPSIEDVPLPIMKAFVTEQVTRQVQTQLA